MPGASRSMEATLFRLPDLTLLIWLAALGMIVAAGSIVTGLVWAGYHLFRALALYLGRSV